MCFLELLQDIYRCLYALTVSLMAGHLTADRHMFLLKIHCLIRGLAENVDMHEWPGDTDLQLVKNGVLQQVLNTRGRMICDTIR